MSAAAAGRLLIKFNQDHLVNRFSAGDKKISLTLIQMKTHSSIFPPLPHYTYFIQLLPLGFTGVHYRFALMYIYYCHPNIRLLGSSLLPLTVKLKSHYVNGKIRKFNINKCWKYSKKKNNKICMSSGKQHPRTSQLPPHVLQFCDRNLYQELKLVSAKARGSIMRSPFVNITGPVWSGLIPGFALSTIWRANSVSFPTVFSYLT